MSTEHSVSSALAIPRRKPKELEATERSTAATDSSRLPSDVTTMRRPLELRLRSVRTLLSCGAVGGETLDAVDAELSVDQHGAPRYDVLRVRGRHEARDALVVERGAPA
jgi:hypothetical protein